MYEQLTEALKSMNIRSMAQKAIATEYAKYEPLHEYYKRYEGKQADNIVEAVKQQQAFNDACAACGLD